MSYTDKAGDVLRCTQAALLPGSQVEQWNLWYKCVANSTTDNRLDICRALDTAFQSRLLAFYSTATKFYGTKASLPNPKPAPVPVSTIVNVAGTDGGVTLPTQTRLLVSLYTQFSGRKYRGRIYLPTPSTNQVFTGGTVTPGLVAAMDTWFTDVVSAGSGAGRNWVMAIASRTLPPVVQYNVEVVTGHQSSSKFATQRKGGAYGRPNSVPWVIAD